MVDVAGLRDGQRGDNNALVHPCSLQLNHINAATSLAQSDEIVVG